MLYTVRNNKAAVSDCICFFCAVDLNVNMFVIVFVGAMVFLGILESASDTVCVRAGAGLFRTLR